MTSGGTNPGRAAVLRAAVAVGAAPAAENAARAAAAAEGVAAGSCARPAVGKSPLLLPLLADFSLYRGVEGF